MAGWNLVLQYGDLPARSSTCDRFTLPGLARPCRILVLACDAGATAAAQQARAEIESVIHARSAGTPYSCNGPALDDCLTWNEPGCAQILVSVLSAPLDAAATAFMVGWQQRAGAAGQILPALLPGLNAGTALAGSPSSVTRLNIAPWGGDPARLASIVVRSATQSRRAGVFLSYRRVEAAPLADQLFDALARRGYDVFLDRFCGRPGCYFPHELAAAMADKAMLVVLNTPRIQLSRWTQWEIRFARRYRLGLLALCYPSVVRLSGVAAQFDVHPDDDGELAGPDLEDALDRIDREHALSAVRRRAYYETPIATAAAAGGGSAVDAGAGLLELRDGRGARSAVVLPSGLPGRLADAHALDVTVPPGAERVLVGQHRHLPLAAREDLEWLARLGGVTLVGPFAVHGHVKRLC